MLDRPLLGQRVFDVMRVVQMLAADGHRDIHLAGKGWGALPALFAALLSAEVSQLTLKNALSSFTDIAISADYKWPCATMPRDVLRHFDIPDVIAALSDKKTRLIDPWSAADGMS